MFGFGKSQPNDHTIQLIRRDTNQVASTEWVRGKTAANRIAERERRQYPPNLIRVVVRHI
jgi:hypothetical protein